MTESSSSTASAIDYWCNLFTPDGLRRLYVDPPEFSWVRETWKLGDRLRGHQPTEFSKVLEAAGFERVGIPAMKVYNTIERRLIWNIDVSDVSRIVDAYPNRFFGLYGVNPFDRMSGVREMESAVRENGFRAALLHPHGFGLNPGAREWFPFYAKCVELDIPVFTLVGHAAEQMPSEPGRPIYLEDVALHFPELRIVGCSGWPWVDEMIAMAWKFPNVFYGTSQYAPRHWPADLVKFANGRGIGKVMFGTGYPVLSHQEAIDQIGKLGLSDEARTALLEGTARTVLGYEQGEES